MAEKMLTNKNKLTRNEIIAFVVVFTLLVLLTLFTRFYGTTDIKDYTNVSKFLAGDYNAKIRSSHSFLYGAINSPFVGLFNNFFIFKIISLVSLLLLILSVYYISGKNKRALWLMLFSPIVWYMAPWISPIQTASLLLLWGYYFINKYEKENKIKYLFYSGLFVGLGWGFWGSILFFGILLGISFLYNKKLNHVLIFVLAVFLGLLPNLILDYILFGFPFYTTIKHIMAVIAFSIFGGFYNQGSDFNLINLITVLFFIPWILYLIFDKKIFNQNKKQIIFLILSFLLLISNPQIRIALAIVPIMIVLLSSKLSKKQFYFQIAVFLIITLIVVNPYLIQIKYQTNNPEFASLVKNFQNTKVSSEFYENIIFSDLRQISEDYSDEVFVVGNTMDEYADLAFIYWGDDIKEFVSIQDYNLFLNNETTLQQQTFCTKSKIANRRDYCISMTLRKSFNDKTNYSTINYALSPDEKLELENFELVKKYQKLNVFEKIS